MKRRAKRKLRAALETTVLGLTVLLSLASFDSGSSGGSSGGNSGCGGGGWVGDDRNSWAWPDEASIRFDAVGAGRFDAVRDVRVTAPVLWPLVEIYAHQTAVSIVAPIIVRGMHWRYHSKLSSATVQLLMGPQQVPVAVQRRITDRATGRLEITPLSPLPLDTDFILRFPSCDVFRPNIRCPEPIAFSTREAPRVIGLWRVEDTLLVVFSETMDPDTLSLSHGSFDLVFDDDGVERSVLSDLDPGNFSWSTDGSVLFIAPIEERPFHVLLGSEIRAMSGAPLDSDHDGVADGRAALLEVWPDLLKICAARDDYPEPCIGQEEADPESVTFTAPSNVEFDL
jgi:hypothetical protein